MKATPGSEAASLRIVKKLSPASRGAIQLAKQFGETLICVRHRVDSKGQFRYTTIELLVSKARITPRLETLVGVRIGRTERSLQEVVKSAGAVWDHNAKLWKMPRRVASILRLSSRVVPM